MELKTKIETVGFRVLWITSFVTLLLPLMLFSRITLGIRVKRPNRESAFKELKLSAQLNTVLEKVGDLELAMLRKGISLPAGVPSWLWGERNSV
jgi:hypothetical protein